VCDVVRCGAVVWCDGVVLRGGAMCCGEAVA
jgi:hypothetical protein